MSEPATAPSTCSRCHAAVAPDDLRCVLCGLTVPEEMTAPTPKAPRAAILRCSNCGAAVRYSVEHQAPACAFCRHVMQVERPTDPIEHAQWFAPFALSEEQAARAMKAWLGRGGFFRPSDLASTSSLRSLEPLWWACWLVNAEALVSWTADSEVGHGRSAWAPHAGQSLMRFDGMMVHGSRGLRVDETAQLGGYDLRALGRAPVGPARAALECFGLRSAARRQVGAALRGAARWRVNQECIPGRQRRNVHVAELIRALQVDRLALPAYVLAYEYRGRRFRAIVHGQDASRVVGERPLARWKVALAVALLILLVVALAVAAWWPRGGELWVMDLFGREPPCSRGYDCQELADRYRYGRGVGKSERRAAKYYRRACDMGYLSGCQELGLLYDAGRGVKQSRASAYAYYRVACAGGGTLGCEKLSAVCWRDAPGDRALGCYELGEAKRTAPQPEDSDAAQAYLAACGAGARDGCLRVEQMCSAGSTYACFPLAQALHGGQVLPRDDARARAIWVKLCAKDHAPSCYQVGQLARDGTAGPVDEAGAVIAFGKACRLGERAGCNRQRELCAKKRVAACP